MWRKVAATVTPLERRRAAKVEAVLDVPVPPSAPVVKPSPVQVASPHHPAAARRGPLPRAGEDKVGLDSSWERKIARGGLEPDFSLDLHGSGLDQAYGRLMHGLAQARAMGARVVLVVTGKPRPTEAADRGTARGAIRAKIVDWLGASEHAGAIAAVRGAHRRHGGPGALYVVLKRKR
ncbi:DNA mismatch repair protein MutS [Novosphingobium sp. 9U]|nr:DNA mismatch repair protein MutS [Novosphingobium sp. 9U]